MVLELNYNHYNCYYSIIILIIIIIPFIVVNGADRVNNKIYDLE